MRVQLQLEAQNLNNVAGLFKGYSDPYAVVQLQSSDEEPCKTEYIKNCLDPKWCGPLYLECPNDLMELNVLVKIFDHNGNHKEFDDGDHDPADDTLMESITFDLKPLIVEEGSEAKGDEFELDGGGKLKVHAFKSEETEEQLIFQLRAMNLRNVEKGFLGLGRTDPYFEIAKKYARPSIGIPRLQPVYRSRVMHNHLNPVWAKASINLEHLCDGDDSMPLVITVFDGTEDNTFISKLFTRYKVGSAEILLDDLLDNVAEEGNGDLSKAFYLKIPNKNRDVGQLIVLEAKRI